MAERDIREGRSLTSLGSENSIIETVRVDPRRRGSSKEEKARIAAE